MPENLDQLDASLDSFTEKKIKSAVLDLRCTPPSEDFDQAVEVLRRFVPKGKLLFTIRRPSDKQERIFTSNQDPKFGGMVTVLVDGENSGASEVIAAALHAQAGAMNVGEGTAGRAVEYAERRLPSGQVIRYAVAEVVLADGSRVFPKGIAPDLEVRMSEKSKRQIMRLSLEKGVSQFVFDKERPRMNEAALVAGNEPWARCTHTDDQSDSPDGTKNLRDIVLQRAVDLITTIAIFQDSKK